MSCDLSDAVQKQQFIIEEIRQFFRTSFVHCRRGEGIAALVKEDQDKCPVIRAAVVQSMRLTDFHLACLSVLPIFARFST